jgi:hypothetical protein
MGLDWTRLGWAEYQMHLAAWNEAHRDPKEKRKGGEPDLPRLRKFVEAHTLH